MEGQTFSHYTILERLGGGGMGVVYKALDTTLDRHVALKFLPPELTRDDEARRRFMQEAKAASALDHPNVCAIHEITSTPDDQLFIAMGYYAGETLKQRIARGPLPVVEALDIVRQVGAGLAEAHATGIVHRDIKPANIIVTASGLVKILDFGIAKLTGATGLTETGITLGTVSYMSPEQVNGEEAGPQSDVWALGAVFYEMLTGRPPFPGDRPAVVMHGITDRPPAPLRELRSGVSPDVARVVTRALEKSRVRRYATAREFLAAMPAGGAPAAMDPEATTADATRLNNPTLGPGTAASQVPSIAVLPFADMSQGKDQDYFCEGLAEELIDALARIEGLRVVARMSAFQFQAKGHDLRVVGEKLKVTTVLEGSVRKAGNRLRINAQLINVADGYHLWSERYDREMDDIFAVQDEIARAVVTELKVKLLGASSQPMVTRPTESLEAYSCYMQGRHYRFSRYNVAKANQCFEEAVRHDPAYSAAWMGVGEAAVLGGLFLLQRPREAAAKANTAVERALALDDGLADAHVAAGKIRFWFDWRWDDAEREFRRAIELNPTDVDTYASYATALAYIGRTEEALTQATKALEIDPLSTHALVRSKPTASGRATRRASSDPACLGGKSSRFPFRGRPFRARKENLPMDDWQSLAHVRWECKYHVVIIPKFRRKVLYGQLRAQVGRILRGLCDQRGVELIEGKAMADHVHLCLSIPPKYSVAHTIGFLKGKSAVQIHRKLLRERRMTGLHFWSTGYCVSTVGLDEGRIREYIREQEQLEAGQGDLDLK